MPNFSTRAIGAAGRSDTTGIIEYTTTEGTGPYEMRGPMPGFITLRARVIDRAYVRYRVAGGTGQEIGDGIFYFAENVLVRATIKLPLNRPIDWGAGRKLVYILHIY